jgi:hypothetical protein
MFLSLSGQTIQDFSTKTCGVSGLFLFLQVNVLLSLPLGKVTWITINKYCI